MDYTRIVLWFTAMILGSSWVEAFMVTTTGSFPSKCSAPSSVQLWSESTPTTTTTVSGRTEFQRNGNEEDPAMEGVLDLVGDDDFEEDFNLEWDEATDAETSPSPGFLSHQRQKESSERFRVHTTDTGSPEYQVAGLTERILYLTQHLQQHPKDLATRRGLVALVNRRRRLLNYLHRQSPSTRYSNIVESLGIRHRPPSKVQSRLEKYGHFPKQKKLPKHKQSRNRRRK